MRKPRRFLMPAQRAIRRAERALLTIAAQPPNRKRLVAAARRYRRTVMHKDAVVAEWKAWLRDKRDDKADAPLVSAERRTA